ncbi:MAG: acyl carrier protein [Opitutia bacterium]|jgi:acyl carrier protein
MSSPAAFISELESSLENCPKGSLTPETRFRDQAWWDSLAALTALAVFDTVYGKQLTADQLRQCHTIGDICAHG